MPPGVVAWYARLDLVPAHEVTLTDRCMDRPETACRSRRDRRALVRRLIVVVALMFWQGGFTFYAAVVVPVGQTVLGSHRRQGMITRVVTDYLNLTGAAALVPLAWDVAAADGELRRRRARWLAWGLMAVMQAVLFWLHGHLNALVDPERATLLDATAFRTGHRWYLWVSTIQWGAGIAYVILMLFAWRWQDRADSAVGSDVSS